MFSSSNSVVEKNSIVLKEKSHNRYTLMENILLKIGKRKRKYRKKNDSMERTEEKKNKGKKHRVF